MKEFIFVCFLSVAAAYDGRTQQIPNCLLKGMICSGVICNALLLTPILDIMRVCIGSFLVGLVLYSMRVLGAGDVKLMTICGLFISGRDMAFVWFVALLVTAILGVFLYASKKQLQERVLMAVSYLTILVESKKIIPYKLGTHSVNAITFPFGVSVLFAELLVILVEEI